MKITAPETGLVQNREEFLLPDDAYPKLQNAYVWRERIKRKKCYQLLGRLQRAKAINTTLSSGAGQQVNLISALSLESSAQLTPKSLNIVGATDGTTYTDPNGNGVLLATGGTGTGGTINYSTGLLTINAGGGQTITGTINYYPMLPVMGICKQEQQNSATDLTIVFDQKYAYQFNAGSGQFQEFIPGTTWNAHNGNTSAVDFFWSTNYWVSSNPLFSTTNKKLFWVTNNTGEFLASADPPRITDGTTWVNFFPSTWSQIDATTYLTNFLCMLPFRGRMVTFNTWEGASAAASVNYSNRIRWSTIGNPFIAYSAGPPATGSWRDDIRGQGGYLDIPTSEDIVSVGFVRDNLVIYCERSTWQLRYTGRSIAPFQIEKVNSELGTASTFSTIQFDTSLVGIGDKGIVECDSYKSERIDIKIPDFVFQLNYLQSGLERIQGIRDFQNRLAFWTIPLESAYDSAFPSTSRVFPNQRLVYNYENDSWALFDDSFTSFGTYQTQSSRTWINTNQPWIKCNFPWINQPQGVPIILAGNQQGFVEQLTELTTNDISLSITGISGQDTTATVITCPNHNLRTGSIIGISGIPTATPFANLNGEVFSVVLGDQAGSNHTTKFRLYKYNSTTGQFSDPQLDASGQTYVGIGYINIRDNFSITSKKFNFLDEGQSIQLGYIDLLMASTGNDNPGAISLNVYLDYDDVNPSNTLPQNQIDDGNEPVEADSFFNTVIPTTPSNYAVAKEGTKFWQRVFCPTRGNFLTLEYTLSNAQMAGTEQELDVQIDAQVLWIRKSGRLTQF